ncbi:MULTISPECIES: hypothetical protein [unclassified Kitasatospora]|uniref:hypothetical protein n=1 Tax=unclassified Kitasatospora TaxID=2633591 RepID=UPI0034019D67
MNGDDPAFDADDMGALFRTVLDQPEPATPAALLPEVRRSGARLRRRRHLLATVATAAAVGLLATAGWAVRGRTPVEGSGREFVPAASAPGLTSAMPSPSVPPSPAVTGTGGTATGGTAPGSTTPGRPTTGGPAADGSLSLLALLRAHPPEDIVQVFRGATANDYLLTRTDGGTVTVSRRLDGPAGPSGGTDSPCGPRSNAWGPMNPEGEDCVGMKLPDGSTVWALHPLSAAHRGREAQLRIVTPDDLAYVLLFVRAGARPQPGDPTVPLPQLLVLSGQPGFVAAVRDGWGDPIFGPTTPPGPPKTPGPSTTPGPPKAPGPPKTSTPSPSSALSPTH